MSLENSIKNFDKMFDIFNSHFYNGELIKPVITIQSNGRKKNVLGWCTRGRVWKDKEENLYYEINMSAEYLFEDIYELSDTLLHEMAHLFNSQHNIQDVSRSGGYHNKRFKETAENHGLIVDYDPTLGFAYTRLKDSTKSFVDKNIDSSVFNFSRVILDQDKKASKQSGRKYVCESCKTIIRATKKVNVICADCKVLFVEEE